MTENYTENYTHVGLTVANASIMFGALDCELNTHRELDTCQNFSLVRTDYLCLSIIKNIYKLTIFLSDVSASN